jgi:hypothetical protein
MAALLVVQLPPVEVVVSVVEVPRHKLAPPLIAAGKGLTVMGTET